MYIKFLSLFPNYEYVYCIHSCFHFALLDKRYLGKMFQRGLKSNCPKKLPELPKYFIRKIIAMLELGDYYIP